MLKNYIKITLRNIRKNTNNSIVNIAGLAVGLLSCMVIYLYVTDELSYDQYHPDLNRIHRIAVRSESLDLISESATICAPVAAILEDHFPEVEAVAQILPVSAGLIQYENTSFYESNRMFANTALFQILSIPFERGNPATALERPATVVISKKMAEKYFGSLNPVGKTLSVNSSDYEVTGVVQNAPANTHLKYDFILSLKTLEGRYPFSRWFLSNLYIYVKHKADINLIDFTQRVSAIAHDYAKEELNSGEKVTYFLQPVKDIHLHSHLRNETETGIQPFYLTVLSMIGLFILIIACINFMNITTARSDTRAKEIGIRKVSGARRSQLIGQFQSESIFLALSAFGLALLSLIILLPLINTIMNKQWTEGQILNPVFVLTFTGISLLTGLLSGSYPAFFLSGLKPVSNLQKASNHPSALIRKILVIGQFSISIILMVCTLVIFRQVRYMENRALGFSQEQKLIVPLRRQRSIADNYFAIKNEFMKHASVKNVSFSSGVPGDELDRWDTDMLTDKEPVSRPLNYLYIDADFLGEYQVKMAAGRTFDRKKQTDINQSYIINKTALKEFGWQSPDEAIGRQLNCFFQGNIIGVTEDFHYTGLQSEIEPLAMVFNPNRFSLMTLHVASDEIRKTIGFVQNTWTKLFPELPFEYYFLDEQFNRQYQTEKEFGNLVSIFTLLGVWISCMGLFGLSSFLSEQKTKEIGIRKILGSSITGVLFLFSKVFIQWVLIANIIAWPIAWISVRRWLQNFAYPVDLSIWIFVISGFTALFIALFTISWQAVRAAAANPVKALKYE